MYRVVQSRPGVVRLADGAEFILRITMVGVKNMGFPPLAESISWLRQQAE